ncbi:hypothetical protein AVEN_1182-1 [Araneus ventricosus]|uniref:Uncharacterized protein n=1 Tax=Araneus ventricosus TaxID=182803 RepID=A0A4Y2EBR8_ARAVE|nr:hypothetical protein AVEN_1182-1 [Araneus ventricosus]
MEMDFIYNGCLFTTVAPKNKQTPSTNTPFVHAPKPFYGDMASPRGGKEAKNTRDSDRLSGYIPMDAPASGIIYIRLLSATGHLSREGTRDLASVCAPRRKRRTSIHMAMDPGGIHV